MIRFPLIPAGFCLVAATLVLANGAQAAIVANFTGGFGTDETDKYLGMAGEGWVAGWTSTGSGGSTVVDSDPLLGGGNYLQFNDNSVTTSTGVRREYSTSGEVAINQPHRISFDFRFDSPTTNFTAFADRIAMFGDITGQTGTSTSNTWLIGVVASNSGAGTGQSAFDNRWFFFDNNGSTDFATANMVDTGISFVSGRVYSITVDVDPTTGTYSASIDDGVNPLFSASNLTFRRGAGAANSDFVHFYTNSSTASDSSSFSLDSILIVPEPGVAGLLGLVSLGFMAARGKRRR